ncbi:hypothetical protein ABG067_001422 [Albugo candida]
MELVHQLLTKCLDHIALYGNEGVLVSTLFAEVLHDVPSPSVEIQKCLWKLLLGQAASSIITFHVRPSQVRQYCFSSATSVSGDEEESLTRSNVQVAKESVLFCTVDCPELKQDQLHKAANRDRLALLKALSMFDDVHTLWSSLHVVGCHDLRLRALNLPPREYFEQSQMKILEFIGQCRHIGITFSELQKKLEADMVRKMEETYVLPVHNGKLCLFGHDTLNKDDFIVHAKGDKDAKPTPCNLKKLHYILDTLISYRLVVKRIMLVQNPTLRRLNILHLPRFAGMFHPEMLNKTAEFVFDDTYKAQLIQSAINYLQKQVNKSAVVVEMGYDLGLNRRQLEVLRTCIARETKKNAQSNMKFPLIYYQAALPHRGNSNKEKKLLNCVKYVGVCEEVHGTSSQSLMSRSGNEYQDSVMEMDTAKPKGIFIELGLIQHLYDYIIKSQDRGTTIIDLRNEYSLPGSKLPYKLLGETVSRYQLVARQELIGKNDGFRFFSRASADGREIIPKVCKDDLQKAKCTPQQYPTVKNKASRTDADDVSGLAASQRLENNNLTAFSKESAGTSSWKKTFKDAINSEGVHTVEGNRIQRLFVIMERVEKEKIVALYSLKASIIAFESKIADKRGNAHIAALIDTRTLQRLVLQLQSENKLKVLKREIQPRNVTGKVRTLHYVVSPSHEHDEAMFHDFMHSCARDERLRRIHQSQSIESNVMMVKDRVYHDATGVHRSFASAGTNGLNTCPTAKDHSMEAAQELQDTSGRHLGPVLQYRERGHLKRYENSMIKRQYRKLGLAFGVMFRSKVLHEFLWTFLNQNPNNHIREFSDQRHTHCTTAENGTSGILFSLQEVLDAMPVSTYITIFAGGSLLNAQEFAQVQNVISSNNTFSALPDDLRERLRYRERMRTRKALGILVDLHLILPRRLAIGNLKDVLVKKCNDADLCDEFSRALFANANNYLFLLRTENVRIVLSLEKDTEGADNFNVMCKKLTSLRVFGYAEDKYSFGFDLPLRFDFITYDQVTQYWQALECLCLEKVMAEMSSTSALSCAFSRVPLPERIRTLQMFRVIGWKPHGQKIRKARNLPIDTSGIVSRLIRKRRISKNTHTAKKCLKRQKLSEKSASSPTASETTKWLKKTSREVTSLPSRRRGTRSAISLWTTEQDELLQNLYIKTTKANWLAPIPNELKESQSVVCFRAPCFVGLRANYREIAKTLGKTRQDVLQRLKKVCNEPRFLLMMEHAKHELQTKNTVFSDEESVIASNDLTALFRRAVMMNICSQEEYNPLIAEQLVCQWHPNNVRLIWRYLWLNSWIVRSRAYTQHDRVFVPSQYLRNFLKLQPPTYPVSLFLQAADPDSMIESNQGYSPTSSRDLAVSSSDIPSKCSTYQHCTRDGETSTDDQFFETDAVPGDCALVLSCQVLGSCILVPSYQDNGNGDLPVKTSMDEKRSKVSSIGNNECNNKTNVVGFAAHVTEYTGCVDHFALIDLWQVVLRFRFETTGTPDVPEQLQTFSMVPLDSESTSCCINDINPDWTAFKPLLVSNLENDIISTTEKRCGEGITFDDLLLCLKMPKFALAEDGKIMTAIHSSSHGSRVEEFVVDVLNSCVKKNQLLRVNGYDRQIYVHPKFGNKWLLHSYKLVADRRCPSIERVDFDLSKGTLLYPWSKMDGEVNEMFLVSIQRRIVACLLEKPGITDRHIQRELNGLLTLQDTREVLAMLVRKAVIYYRGMQSLNSGGQDCPTTMKKCMLWDRCFQLSKNISQIDGSGNGPSIVRLQLPKVDHGRKLVESHYFPHVDLGIVGLPNVGKSTLFNALTKTQIAQAANYPFCTIDPNIALTAVPDERVHELAKLENSQQTIETQVSVIAHVLRCFEDTDIVHVDSRIDPISDLLTVRTELALADLQTVERKLENMTRKKTLLDKKNAVLLHVLERSKAQLENDLYLQRLDFEDSEERIQFEQLQLLTAKKVLYLCNVSEGEAKSGNEMTQNVSTMAKSEGNICLVISAALEEAAASFEDDATQLEYLESCGMAETGLTKVIQACRDILQLQTFYTVGPKEARAWSIRKGFTAAEAAATIHSDFARLLIRAETISYHDFIQAGNAKIAKEKGLTRAEGKDYICQDGDVFNFLGAALVYLLDIDDKVKSKKMLDAMLGFAGGVMLAASYWSLLAPAIDIAQESQLYGTDGRWVFLPVSIGFALGAGAMLATESILLLLQSNSIKSHDISKKCDDMPKQETSEHDLNPMTCFGVGKNVDESRRVLLLVIAITLHNFPEGLAVGVGFGSIGQSVKSTFANAVNLAVGVGLQNFPEGLVVSMPLRRAGMSPFRAFMWGQLSGIVEPVGGILGAASVLYIQPLLPYALSFAAGAMIFVVVDDLIPEANRSGNSKLATIGIIAGFIVMMSLDVAFS